MPDSNCKRLHAMTRKMPTLDRARILVDFNEMVEEDVVLLSREDTRRDSSGDVVELQSIKLPHERGGRTRPVSSR